MVFWLLRAPLYPKSLTVILRAKPFAPENTPLAAPDQCMGAGVLAEGMGRRVRGGKKE